MTTVPDSHISLLTQNQVVVLATEGANGYPQVSAVWFALDADGVVGVSLNRTRQKTKNLLANPRATLFFVDPASPYRTVEIRSDVEILDDADYRHAVVVNAKYSADVSANDGPGESRVWVRFPPLKVNTFG